MNQKHKTAMKVSYEVSNNSLDKAPKVEILKVEV